jgi:hypothetical protein
MVSGGKKEVKKITNNAALMPTYLWDDKQRPEHLGDGLNGVVDLLHGRPEPPPRIVVLRGRLVAIGWRGNELGLWLCLPIACIAMRPIKPTAATICYGVGETTPGGYPNGFLYYYYFFFYKNALKRGCFGARFDFATVRLSSWLIYISVSISINFKTYSMFLTVYQ